VRLVSDLLTGTLDRLVLIRRDSQVIAADIIDYKTDSVAEGRAADLEQMSHYRQQLHSYADAIAQVYRLDTERITRRLVFVQSGQVVNV
jgi:ATP-dependent helicase/nuclease subunit A